MRRNSAAEAEPESRVRAGEKETGRNTPDALQVATRIDSLRERDESCGLECFVRLQDIAK